MRLFQIYEADLEVLERELPNLSEFAQCQPEAWNNRPDIREGVAMVQKIISNVRWNYGPPTEIKRVDEE